MVGGEGFEPPKAVPPDLQSGGRSLETARQQRVTSADGSSGSILAPSDRVAEAARLASMAAALPLDDPAREALAEAARALLAPAPDVQAAPAPLRRVGP